MYSKDISRLKFRKLWIVREDEELFDDFPYVELDTGERIRISTLGERDGVAYEHDFRQFKEKYPTARLFGLNPLKSGGFRRNQCLHQYARLSAREA
jgi:adenine-specific DNA-methyltransferase